MIVRTVECRTDKADTLGSNPGRENNLAVGSLLSSLTSGVTRTLKLSGGFEITMVIVDWFYQTIKSMSYISQYGQPVASLALPLLSICLSVCLSVSPSLSLSHTHTIVPSNEIHASGSGLIWLFQDFYLKIRTLHHSSP